MQTNKKKLRYNIKCESSTGIQGVYYCKGKTKPYRAGIIYQKKKHELGRFLTLEEAVEARKEAKARFSAVKHEKENAQYLDSGQGQKIIDLTGKIYPHFKVIKYAGLGPSHVIFWVSLCQCGKTFISTSTNIRMGLIVSCRCVKDEVLPKGRCKCSRSRFDGIRITKLQNIKPYKNSKSGIKGVSQDMCGTWYATLSVGKVRHKVRCDSKEQTLYQRAMLEKKYQDPVIKEYLEEMKKKK